MTNIIDKLIETYPELSVGGRGVPFVGKRSDNNDFSCDVKKIAEGYSLYTNELFDLRKKNVGYNGCRLDSGDPTKFGLFPLILKRLKKLNKYMFYNYPRASGDLKCRQEIIKYLNEKEFLETVLNENNLIFSISTTHAFNMILKTISHPNDVIIFTAPNYGLFALMCERLSVNVEFVELREEDNYIVNVNDLSKKVKDINRKLKEEYKDAEYIPKVIAFFNANPNNPLGTYIGKDNINVLDGLGKLCKENSMYLIDDLVYKDLIYDRKNFIIPVGYNREWFDNTISLY